MTNAINTSSTGERVFAGPVDDPFFVDLGGIFDLGDAPRQGPTRAEDGLACINVSSIALEVDISTLQKEHKGLNQAANILDPAYVIGVWASASRQKIAVLNDIKENDSNDPYVASGQKTDEPGHHIQRPMDTGFPTGHATTNEAVIPIGEKDLWNRLTLTRT